VNRREGRRKLAARRKFGEVLLTTDGETHLLKLQAWKTTLQREQSASSKRGGKKGEELKTRGVPVREGSTSMTEKENTSPKKRGAAPLLKPINLHTLRSERLGTQQTHNRGVGRFRKREKEAFGKPGARRER